MHRGLGVTLLGLVTAARFIGGDQRLLSGPGEPIPAEPLADVLFGLLDVALEATGRASRGVRGMAERPVRVALSPAIATFGGPVGTALRVFRAATGPLAERGARLRADAEAEAAAAVAAALPETVDAVMSRIDLTNHVIDRVDMQRIMDAVFESTDMEGFVIDRLDLARVVDASLDEVDLTDLALRRLDLGRVVDATLDQVDALALARDRLDPVRVAGFLRDNVDLGDALRTAPGAVAGEAMRGVRETMGRILTSSRE